MLLRPGEQQLGADARRWRQARRLGRSGWWFWMCGETGGRCFSVALCAGLACLSLASLTTSGPSSCVVFQRAGRYVVVTACHAKNIPKMVDLQNTPRQGLAAAQRGCGAPNQGWGRYFGRPWRPGSRPNHPQSAPSKSLRILLWAPRFSKNRPSRLI